MELHILVCFDRALSSSGFLKSFLEISNHPVGNVSPGNEIDCNTNPD